MGFSGGGSNITKAHTHSTAIVQDGGALNFSNVTQAGMAAGDITYSNGTALQILNLGNASDSLAVNAGATAPEWVAAAGGSATTFFFLAQNNFSGTSSTFFACFSSHGDWGYTESEFTIPCNTALTFTRFQINIRANNKASDQVTAFRDDSSDVAPITIPASTTGTFDSGVVSVSIEAGSEINWVYHATVSGLIDMYASLGTVTS